MNASWYDILALVGSSATGYGGNVTIETASLSLSDGAQISASTFGLGNAGDLSIAAFESVELSGTDLEGDASGLFANTEIEADGDGGSINLATSDFLIANGATVTVDSLGLGSGGDLFIQVESLTLDNNASIAATTTSGTGGNVAIQVDGILSLDNNSLINAGAFENANGGNISIDTEFIIAFPSQVPNGGNDIIASAEQGFGGNIEITANTIFGIQERPLNPFTNDINASSQFGLAGL